MVYVLSYLCLIAATLSAFTPVLPSMFVYCAPVYNNHRSNLSVSTSTSVVTSINLINISPTSDVGTPHVSLSLSPAHAASDSDSKTVSVVLNSRVFLLTSSKSNDTTKFSDFSDVNINTTSDISDSVVDISSGAATDHFNNLNESLRALRTSRSLHQGRVRMRHHHHDSDDESFEEDESFVDDNSGRNERSTNLSHITGTSRKIQMYVTNQHLQILPDGTVNGTGGDTSIYCKYPFFLIIYMPVTLPNISYLIVHA